MQQTDWNGLSADEKDGFVSSLVEYGTDFVAPLYSVVEKIEETLQQKNSAVRAQADARPVAYQHRMRAYEREEWSDWHDVHEGVALDCEKTPTLNGWVYEIRRLYTHPEASAPGLSDDEITDVWIKHGGPLNGNNFHSFARDILTRASAATEATLAQLEAERRIDPAKLNMPLDAALRASAATVGGAFVPALLTDGPACIAPEKRPAYRAGWNDARTAVLNHQAAQQQTSQGASHEWDASGERCLKCGDKDWFAGSTCSAKAAQQQAEPTNGRLRKGMQEMMARLTFLLDEDQFAEMEQIAKSAGVEPEAVQQQAEPSDKAAVPTQPTQKMIKAAADAWLDCGSKLILNKAAEALKAGIAAATKTGETK